ncbi:hypothetical protein PAB09_01225 [Corynebacterium sp. SCR221107]|uniref:suppressor of fused domain protein n=1 Tax=Corynebacterium sp. SCR221107 TaxID=3017361 RepID=UPI0022EC62CE|nr:suppressor of fused domain protein [Corynebacterium sp. SCR221107]WBT08999.1 hypothetical protein PAB09_01225 [Corynebacterium sp. SCR221107]
MNATEIAAWIDQLVPGELVIHTPVDNDDALDMGTVNLGAEVLATTLEFSAVDTGLSFEGKDVRSELFTVARVSAETALLAVSGAAELFRRMEGTLPAQPGTLVPGIGDFVSLPSDITVRHGLCVVPYVWEGQVPQLDEQDRLTVLLQILMLTQEEYEYAVTYGIEVLQEELMKAEVDINDWSR